MMGNFRILAKALAVIELHFSPQEPPKQVFLLKQSKELGLNFLPKFTPNFLFLYFLFKKLFFFSSKSR